MLWTICLVVISFFAIIGLMEFIMCVLETVAMRSTNSLEDVSITVDLRGKEENIEFLLNSLSVMAERIAFKNLTTRIVVRDYGIDEDTYQKIKHYAEGNPIISLIEKDK
ncbi:MAG: hypothetical protein IJN42_04885 [Clostridia bacterium]|nr:hypothetical protein [Clostridia bacterium]